MDKTSKQIVQDYIDYLNAGGRAYNATELSGDPDVDAKVLEPYMAQYPLPVAHQSPNRLNVLDVKASNPKDSIGSKKPRSFRAMSWHVIRIVSLGMFEGGMKYGFHNYRMAGVRASVYFDASIEHLSSWWEGQDIDPDSNLNHVAKAIASLFVLYDAMIQEKWVDDRPPNFVDLNKLKAQLQRDVVDPLFLKYPNPIPAYTHKEMLEQLAAGAQVRSGHEGMERKVGMHPALGAPYGYGCDKRNPDQAMTNGENKKLSVYEEQFGGVHKTSINPHPFGSQESAQWEMDDVNGLHDVPASSVEEQVNSMPDGPWDEDIV